MSEETLDDNKLETTNPDSSAGEKLDGDKGKENEDSEGKVPSSRLREETAKRKETEAENASLKKTLAELSAKVDSIANSKSDLSKAEATAEVAAIAKEYGIDADLVSKLVSAAEKQVHSKISPLVASAQQQVIYKRELDALIDDVPEVEKLTRTDLRELEKRAFSKEFAGTPLKTIYRDMMFDKQGESTGKKKTAETSRPGGSVEREGSEPDWGKMDPDTFRAKSAQLDGRRKRR